MAEVRCASSPEPVARLIQCCFRSAPPTLSPAPRAGISSVAAISRPPSPRSTHAASLLMVWPELMAHEMSDLIRAEAEPGDGQRRAVHEHEIVQREGRVTMLDSCEGPFFEVLCCSRIACLRRRKRV